MASLSQINAAANDPDLRARLELAAAAAGVAPTDAASRQVVWDRIVHVVSRPLDKASGQTLADVLSFGRAEREKKVKALPPAAGADESVITDDMLREAVTKALAQPQATPSA